MTPPGKPESFFEKLAEALARQAARRQRAAESKPLSPSNT